MMQADKILDIGPGAGEFGGDIVAFGSPKEIMKNKNSITGKFLSGKEEIEIPKKRRKWNKSIKLYGAKGNNLKNIDVEFPLGIMTVVTGVSGSGKSTLVNSTLYPILFNKLNKGKLYPLEYEKIEGLDGLEKVINIDQTPGELQGLTLQLIQNFLMILEIFLQKHKMQNFMDLKKVDFHLMLKVEDVRLVKVQGY